jgi:hypothetical protein
VNTTTYDKVSGVCCNRMPRVQASLLCKPASLPFDRFRENFKDIPWVKVPKVLWEHSSSEVLVLEYVPGKLGGVAERMHD